MAEDPENPALGQTYEDEVEEEEEDMFDELPPDHPLLARAQAALKSQLEETEQRLKEEFREKTEALKVRNVSLINDCGSLEFAYATGSPARAPSPRNNDRGGGFRGLDACERGPACGGLRGPVFRLPVVFII